MPTSQEIIPVYLMPGMAASPTIFEYIKLPENQFKIYWLEWLIPNKNETLEDYAKRMVLKVEHDNIVLLGVSFGGILVQEMSKFITVRKLFVVSSIKSKYELPKRMKFARYTKLYKLIPMQLFSDIDVLAKYTFGETLTKRMELYKKYLSVNDTYYLNWSIEQIINWNQEAPHPEAIYIHGSNDAIFTHSCTGNCVVIEGGTHIMIITKYKWFNENLPKFILE